jgi:hypothetical protein
MPKAPPAAINPTHIDTEAKKTRRVVWQLFLSLLFAHLHEATIRTLQVRKGCTYDS